MPPIRTVDPAPLLALIAIAAALGSTCRVAASAEPSTEAGAARALFDEALADMKAGRWQAACPKLERGVLLDQGIGMRHNLALCYEHTGKVASAWRLFTEVAADADKAGQAQRAQVARSHAATLEPRLPHIVVNVSPDARLPELQLKRDGRPLEASAWGARWPADPGEHVIEASAPGRRPWRNELIAREGATATVSVPVLEAMQPGAAGSSAARVEGEVWTDRRKMALLSGGLGVIGVSVGTWFGLLAISRNHDSNDAGCDGNRCPEAAAAMRRDARTYGDVSTTAFVLGTAALAGGVALWVFGAPRDPNAVSVRAGHQGALSGLTLRGAW